MDFKKEYDVAVVGGGIAGVAAALQAARSGKKAVLLEKTILLGGLATTGMIYIYLPLCDGNGRQVTFGICEELIHLSAKYGPGDVPKGWGDARNGAEVERFRAIFSPASFVLALEELLLEAGVDIWLDTLVCGVAMEGDKLSAVQVENKSGSGSIEASCFVDASGDCDVVRKAGAPCLQAENNMSIWAIEFQEGKPFNQDFDLAPGLTMHMGGYGSRPEGVPESCRYQELSGANVTDFVLKGHEFLRERYKQAYESGNESRQSLFPVNLPAMAQFRKTYCLDGRTVLEEGQQGTRFEDSIGLVADWRKPGSVWEVPFNSLLPKGVSSLLGVGRCSSARGDAWEITRVIPAAAMTGQVAGLAAAMAIDDGSEVADINVSDLQLQLRRLGFLLHENELVGQNNESH